MAADFWASSHYKRWIVDRATISRSRARDRLYVNDPEYFDFMDIYFANAIMKLGRKIALRQRVIATAIVFFKRFYLKNAYSETDPFLVIAACCYVATKAEECPVSIKVIASEARALFSQDNYNVKSTIFDHTKIAEMEFYLVDDLECDLTVFHPYRTLTALCKPDPSSSSGGAATTGNSLGVGVSADDGPRYWGTGEGQLELPEGGFQHAWFIINDTYRSNICLLYPPHLIAVAAIYLTVVFHPPSRLEITPHLSSSSSRSSSSTTTSSSAPPPSTTSTTRRSTRLNNTPSAIPLTPSSSKPSPPDTILTFLANMNVSLPLIATIMQEIISLWSLWDRYKEGAADTGTSEGSSSASRKGREGGEEGAGQDTIVTPAMLSSLLVKMREACVASLVQAGVLSVDGSGTINL
ncbi:cyclin-like protein [Amanita rubescens]|nr:cyclin-like protein [Amanita rubescens]